jgi:hypothetical protein
VRLSFSWLQSAPTSLNEGLAAATWATAQLIAGVALLSVMGLVVAWLFGMAER